MAQVLQTLKYRFIKFDHQGNYLQTILGDFMEHSDGPVSIYKEDGSMLAIVTLAPGQSLVMQEAQ